MHGHFDVNVENGRAGGGFVARQRRALVHEREVRSAAEVRGGLHNALNAVLHRAIDDDGRRHATGRRRAQASELMGRAGAESRKIVRGVFGFGVPGGVHAREAGNGGKARHQMHVQSRKRGVTGIGHVLLDGSQKGRRDRTNVHSTSLGWQSDGRSKDEKATTGGVGQAAKSGQIGRSGCGIGDGCGGVFVGLE